MLVYINRKVNQPLEIDYRDGTVIRLAPGATRQVGIHEGYLNHPVTQVYVKNGSLRVVHIPDPVETPEPVQETAPELTQPEDASNPAEIQQEPQVPTRKRRSRKPKIEE